MKTYQIASKIDHFIEVMIIHSGLHFLIKKKPLTQTILMASILVKIINQNFLIQKLLKMLNLIHLKMTKIYLSLFNKVFWGLRKQRTHFCSQLFMVLCIKNLKLKIFYLIKLKKHSELYSLKNFKNWLVNNAWSFSIWIF